MIKMQRVRLINWHNIVDDTLSFEQITYLVGLNAVGKTTLLDAIRYCLTTVKEFNSLGNKKSERTLQGSVHGKQREEDTYTRPGHTVAYVGIEFLDTKKNTTFVITARVESEGKDQDLRSVQQTWYITPENKTLEDLPFLDENRCPTGKEEFCLKDGKMPPIERQNEAKNRIWRQLGIGSSDSVTGRKFGKVFAMGTSADDIRDFKVFIREYVLPQPEIDLEALQEDERELENLESVLLAARQRALELEGITAAGETARQKQRAVDVNRGLHLCADYGDKAGREEEILKGLERCNAEIERLDQLHRQAEADTENAREQYTQARIDSQESDESKALNALQAQRKEVQARLYENRKNLSAYQKAEQKIVELQQRAARHGFELSDELLPGEIQKMPQRRHGELLDKMTAALEEIGGRMEQKSIDLTIELRDARRKRQELAKKIEVLSRGSFIYPENNRAQEVKDKINEMLSAQGMEPDAKILCSLLYMQEADWQSCVESCLGNRRFDILVRPEHYRTAKHAFQKLGQEVGSVSLIDSPAILRDGAAEDCEGSLADKVQSENLLARAYLSRLLGHIAACDDAEELENYRESATKDLLRHYPYRLTRMKKLQSYIGQDSLEKQLAEAKQQAEELREQLVGLEEKERRAKDLHNAFQSVLNGRALTDIREYWDSEKTGEELTAEEGRIADQIREWEENPLLRSMLRRVEILRQEVKEKEKRAKDLHGELSVRKNEAQRYQTDQERAIEEAEQAETVWQHFIDQHPFIQDEIEQTYAEARKKRTPRQLAQSYLRSQSQVESQCSEFINNELIPLQRQYNLHYTCDAKLGLEGMEEYLTQYGQLVNVALEKHLANLQKAKERCRERFRKDVLFRMKDDIAGARRQFSELNRVMKKLTYGEELYQFHIGPSEDPKLAAFYSVIMDDANREVPEEGTLEALAEEKNKVYEAQVSDLMEKIMMDMKRAAEERQQGKTVKATELSAYVDYRSYLNCDITVTNIVTGACSPLSSLSGYSSGGENQSPFYIAICASLMQIYNRCENSVKLVLLDEAFSKMTGDRIRPMMKMFRDMDLQIVLVSTVEKSSAIQPYCDMTYSISKRGMRNSIWPFRADEAAR